MPRDSRIPVTEETWKELSDLKEPEQTYDDLLKELAQHRRRQELEQRFRELEDEDSAELTGLENA
jgi:predicted CopG family antitoxin